MSNMKRQKGQTQGTPQSRAWGLGQSAGTAPGSEMTRAVPGGDSRGGRLCDRRATLDRVTVQRTNLT